MSTTVVYAVNDAGLDADDATYANARSGGAYANSASTSNPYVGQDLGFYVEQFFARFDTSSIPDTDTITSVVAAVWVTADPSTTDFVLECRIRDYGGSVDNGDFVPGADLAALTLVASRSSAGVSVGAYNDLTDVAFPANINKTGYTNIVLCSAEQTNDSQPTTAEDIRISSSLGAGAMRLTIEHSAGGSDPLPPGQNRGTALLQAVGNASNW